MSRESDSSLSQSTWVRQTTREEERRRRVERSEREERGGKFFGHKGSRDSVRGSRDSEGEKSSVPVKPPGMVGSPGMDMYPGIGEMSLES